MSQRDLVAELRAARVQAPVEVRERVRSIAALASAPPRRPWRRRSLVLLVPLAAALAGAILLTRPGGTPHPQSLATSGEARSEPSIQATPNVPGVAHGSSAVPKALAPLPSPTRAQRYSADIGLRVASPEAVSNAVKDALRLTATLGGHPTSVHASSEGNAGTADLVLRVPRRRVQEAVTRLSQLGTITSERVDVQDLQAGLDATARQIVRLQHGIAALHAQPQTPERDRAIAALTAQVQRLQRQSAATLRAAQFATVALHVTTPARAQPVHHRHGPLHGIAVGAYWTGIGALYALAFGLPLALLVLVAVLLARTVRRRRVDALLSRP